MNKAITSQEYGAFVLRVAFGVILLAHASLKVLVFTIPGTVGFFESLGLPAAMAYLTILGEIGGGFAILSGLYTRLSSLLMIPIMAGATWVHSGNGWVFSAEGGGWDRDWCEPHIVLSVTGLCSSSFWTGLCQIGVNAKRGW